jgi:hypothetical protein
MNSYTLCINEESLSSEAKLLINKIKKRYENIQVRQFLNWCILKNIDVRISGEIIINHVNCIIANEMHFRNTIQELLSKLTMLLQKKRFNNSDQHKAYDIIIDIVYVLEREKSIDIDKEKKWKVKEIIKIFTKWIKIKLI